MSIQTVSDQDFQVSIRGHGVTLVDFGASWCPPCKVLLPILEHLDEIYEDKITIVKVDCDESPELASQFGVMSLPTVIIFKDGKPIDKLVGLRPPTVYQSVIDRESEN